MGESRVVSGHPSWHTSATRLSILLTVAAIGLWSLSLVQARFSIGFFGILESLPIVFFVALGLLTIAAAILWVLPEKHEKLLFLQLCLLISALWLTPVLIGGTLPYRWGNYGVWREFTNPVIQQGHFDPAAHWRHSWPGADIFFASMADILGISVFPDTIFAIFPFLFQFALLLPVYVFLRNAIGEGQRNYCWAAAWIFFLGNWVGQDLPDSQSLAYLLLLVTLALLTTPKWQSWPAYRFVVIIILAALVTTHFVTSLVLVAMLIALYLAGKMKILELPLLGVALVLVWTVYISTAFLWQNLGYVLSQFLSVSAAVGAGVVERIFGNESHQAVVQTRILFSGLFAAIAAAGCVALLAKLKVKRFFADNKTILCLGIGILVLNVSIGAAHGFEWTSRTFLFLLPLMAYFAIKLLNVGKIGVAALCLVLITAVPVRIVAHLGNEASDYLPPAFTASSEFIQEKTKGRSFSGHVHPWYIPYIPGSPSQAALFKNFRVVDGQLTLAEELKENLPNYASIGQFDYRVQGFLYNRPQFMPELQDSLNASPDWNLIYVNSEQSLYIREKRQMQSVSQ